jgi:hypothetical protein
MTTRPDAIVTGSAGLYFVAALGLIFAGDELLSGAGAAATRLELALLQLLGAGLFGFAMLNWMNRRAPMGGIYGRPLLMANLAQGMIGALMLLQLLRATTLTFPLGGALLAYSGLTIAFGSRLFGTSRAMG